MLQIPKATTEPCAFCMGDKQVVQAKFADGLSGNFCWRCLWKMVEARAKPRPAAPKPAEPVK